ncbi:DUF2950 family protein [Paraburkholderia sp.]|jgi:hypothetical protein|uniref:DUF2950 family protein n=1 Tax=Paraburkholderia sp. TaxID=1926495 RepID=UPI0026147595|nr:DUF2950 family protein [Paraburkholderia sp.]
MIRILSRDALRAYGLTLVVALSTVGTLVATPILLLGTHAVHAQATYSTADEAANAFVEALARNDDDALEDVLGKNYGRFIPTSDIAQEDIDAFLGAWSSEHAIVNDAAANAGHARAHLAVGPDGWTLPIPIVQAPQGWRFDLPAARDEMTTRRIGRDEHAAVLTSHAYLDAQNVYRDLTQHYARNFTNTPLQRDGLYWEYGPHAPKPPQWPRTPDEAQTTPPASMSNGLFPAEVYRGYRYRILTAQGAYAKDGTRSYLKDGVMTRGFALIASPVEYDETGVMSFIVNQDGQVYQKDLGPQTTRLATAINVFDPNPTWLAVQP